MGLTAAEAKRSDLWPRGRSTDTEDIEDRFCPPGRSYLITRPDKRALFVTYPGDAAIVSVALIDEFSVSRILADVWRRIQFVVLKT